MVPHPPPPSPIPSLLSLPFCMAISLPLAFMNSEIGASLMVYGLADAKDAAATASATVGVNGPQGTQTHTQTHAQTHAQQQQQQ